MTGSSSETDDHWNKYEEWALGITVVIVVLSAMALVGEIFFVILRWIVS